MSILGRFRLFLWVFGKLKIPLIGFVRPRLVALNDEKAIVRIPLNRRNKNHLKSMYFGVLAVGADVAGGFHGFYHADKQKAKVSLAFKSFQANFIKRPTHAVYFVSEDGEKVKQMIEASTAQKKRINEIIHINAYTHYDTAPEQVAAFKLELSIKVIHEA